MEGYYSPTVRRFLETKPERLKMLEWLPLYRGPEKTLVTIITGKLINTPFEEVPSHDAFCQWLTAMDEHWLRTVPEIQI